MAHTQWVDARRALDALPISMYWQGDADRQYLTIKNKSKDAGERLGLRSADTEATLAAFEAEKSGLQLKVSNLNALIRDRAGQYRALRLPALPDKQAEILRRLDIDGLLGTDLMVVGTNAFAAYELACGVKFPVGVEETEVFDLAWCKYTKVSLGAKVRTATSQGSKSLFLSLRSVDPSYKINPRKPYQVQDSTGYEVELLAAPSTHPLPKNSVFDPMAILVEQEWLLQGQPVSHVTATIRHRACPLYVPDPRWMALHKLWLSQKPGRNPAKKPKDERQGHVLLDATRYFLADTYPLDIGFVLDLPDALRPVFDQWAQSRGFDPANPSDGA